MRALQLLSLGLVLLAAACGDDSGGGFEGCGDLANQWLPFHIDEKRPDLGPLTKGTDVHRFNQAVAGHIGAMGLRGPESFRFCRKVAKLGIGEFAELLGYGRKAVQRWEGGENDVPRHVMAFAVLLAVGVEPALEVLQRQDQEAEMPSTVRVDAA